MNLEFVVRLSIPALQLVFYPEERHPTRLRMQIPTIDVSKFPEDDIVYIHIDTHFGSERLKAQYGDFYPKPNMTDKEYNIGKASIGDIIYKSTLLYTIIKSLGIRALCEK